MQRANFPSARTCPLYFRKRTCAAHKLCPLSLQKRTHAVQQGMSALGQKRTSSLMAAGLHLKKARVIRVGPSYVALNSSSPPQCGQGSFWVSVDCKAAPLVTQKAAKPASCCVVLSRLPNHFRACQQWRQAFATVAQPPKDRGEVLAAFARRDPHTPSHWTDKFQRLTA